MNMGYINGSFNKMALPFFLFSIMIGQTQNSIRPPTIPPIQFLLDKDNDGIFESNYSGKEPLPKEGKDEFVRCFTSLIKYPFDAYEKDIKGILILEAIIDESGKILKLDIKNSLFKSCDESAKKAFTEAAEHGYAVLEINNKRVKYKMEYPVLFWLE